MIVGDYPFTESSLQKRTFENMLNPCTHGTRPEQYEQWVYLKPNEVQDGISIVFGIDPKYIPQGNQLEMQQTKSGAQFASIGIHGKEKKEFWGLFVFEPSAIQD